MMTAESRYSYQSNVNDDGAVTQEPQETERVDDSQDEENDGETKEKEAPRQWLSDRIFGKSPPAESKPPCWICYVPPCVGIASGCLEQNCLCECFGKIGVVDSELPGTWRKRLLSVAAFFNVISIFLPITSCFAISTNYNILQAVPFSSGTVRVTNLTSNTSLGTITTDIGLQAVAYSDPLSNLQQVILFDDFCNYNSTGFTARFIAPQDCSACAEVSDSLIFTLAVSAFPYIPSVITDIIRYVTSIKLSGLPRCVTCSHFSFTFYCGMYANYDMNCLKLFGSLGAIVGMALSMYSFLAYRFKCFFSFYEGEVYFDINGNEVPSAQGAELRALVDWTPGNGLICIILATALMGIDIIVNLMVPTPKITRDHAMQEEHEQTVMVSSAVPTDISWKGFVDAFCGMICGGKKKHASDDEEEAVPSQSSNTNEAMDRGENAADNE
jgi:hypothetical protein